LAVKINGNRGAQHSKKYLFQQKFQKEIAPFQQDFPI